MQGHGLFCGFIGVFGRTGMMPVCMMCMLIRLCMRVGFMRFGGFGMMLSGFPQMFCRFTMMFGCRMFIGHDGDASTGCTGIINDTNSPQSVSRTMPEKA